MDRAVFRHCDLSGADLSLADLRGASLAYVELRGTTLRGANLRRSSWLACDAPAADFRKAKLDGAGLMNCRFDECDFSGASFFKATALHSVFTAAEFSDARMFAWSREIVVEILARSAPDLERLKYVGAIALNPSWCYDEWRALVADEPEYRRLALEAMSVYPDSGFAQAMDGVAAAELGAVDPA